MAQQFNKKQPKVGVDSVTRNNTPIYIAIGAVIALAVIGAVIWAVTKDSKTEDANKQTLEFQPVTVIGDPLPQTPEEGGADPAVGKQIPEIKGSTFNGNAVDIALNGKPKVVIFAAHWCPHCRSEMPKISDYLRTNKAKYGDLEMYAVATGSSPDRPNYPPSEWFKALNFPGTVMADDRAMPANSSNYPAGVAYGVAGYPSLVFVDKDNKVVARAEGEVSIDTFGKYIDAALGKGPVPTTVAPPSPTRAG